MVNLSCLPCLLIGTGAEATDATRITTSFKPSIAAPQDFAGLAESRLLVADVYFGGVKVSEAPVSVRPGFLRFRDPTKVVTSIRTLAKPYIVQEALEQDLPSNTGLICSELKTENCGVLAPSRVGIIFNEDLFRVDLFINPTLLEAISPVESGYLAVPATTPSMTSAMGFNLAGSGLEHTSYNLQNRTIFAKQNARVRVNASYSSDLGLITDDLVAELDRRNLRYSAGMHWAPGIDLLGQRRIIGAGISTQLDTRVDKDLLEGTPIFLFLDRAARVEVLADGRLLDSRVYEAGNNRIDTSSLPSGAYSLVFRIHQADGKVREEQRFFARNAQVAPLSKPIYFAYAGVLANTRRNRPISPSRTLFYEAGTAHRLTPAFALDATLIGTQHRGLLQVGAYHLSSKARIRAAGLVSSKRDGGMLLQASASGNSPLTLNIDVRRIWSSDGKPLIPWPEHVDTFDLQAPRSAQLGRGSFFQASGSMGYRVKNAFLSLSGALRRDKGQPADYSIGPNLSVPLVQTQGIQLLLHADAQRTRSGPSSYAGVRLLRTLNGTSLVTSAGYASLPKVSEDERSSARWVGSIAGESNIRPNDGTELNVGGGAERTATDSSIRGHGALYSSYGTLRGDLLHHLGGRFGLQYGMTVQTGVAAGALHSIALGGRNLTQSALLVSIEGRKSDASFDILIDEVPRGRIAVGQQLPIFLQPYRGYKVRLKPADAMALSYDSQAKNFTLFPGTVESIRWSVEHVFTVFGQAVRLNGTPITDASVQTKHGLGQTDGQGYFQVELAEGDEIRLARAGETFCTLPPFIGRPKDGYASLGKMICR